MSNKKYVCDITEVRLWKGLDIQCKDFDDFVHLVYGNAHFDYLCKLSLIQIWSPFWSFY